MRQLLQDFGSGELAIREVPVPSRGPTSLLVATSFSLISAGTERAVLELGRRSLVGKARARPDLVSKVIESARSEGITAAYAKVRGRLGEPNPLGYSLSGIVLEACEGAPAAPGDLVACGGAGYACHAEVVSIPRNLCARVPDGVVPEDAAYATVVAIALHGLRLTQAGIGDVVSVVGLGLLGQLTLDLLAGAGSVAVGVDPDERRAEAARSRGHLATTSVAALGLEVARHTDGRGADAVLVTAASPDNEPLRTAIDVARERAVVCIVGDVRIESDRAPLFAKELRLVVSRSYGPGRYDTSYEEGGRDYPPGYVRWTEGRNIQEAVRLMHAGVVEPSRLTTQVFDIADALEAYELLEGPTPSLGILLRYPGNARLERRMERATHRRRPLRASGGTRVRVGVIGAGAFARSVLLPALRRVAQIEGVANATGPSARAAAERFGARVAATDPKALIGEPECDAVLIATRHDSHASYAAEALRKGKHVFVEKPLALNDQELDDLARAARGSEGILMVGFNRRFSPLGLRLKAAVGGRGPLVVTYRVSAGRLPRGHWTQDPAIGGGRVVGELCHFVDFASFLCGAEPTSAAAAAVAGGSEPRDDSVIATLSFADGSVASITYTAYGDRSLTKERVEVLGEAGAASLDDFRELRLHLNGRETVVKGRRDKGHANEMQAFVRSCRDGVQPWPLEAMLAVTRATFRIREGIRLPAPPV